MSLDEHEEVPGYFPKEYVKQFIKELKGKTLDLDNFRGTKSELKTNWIKIINELAGKGLI